MVDQILQYAVPGTAPSVSRRGKGFLSVCGTAFMHGLGHVFAGRWRRGIFWFALSWGLCGLMILCAMFRPLIPAVIVGVPLGIIATVACLIDSYIVGRRSQRRMLGHPAWRYLSGVAILAASFFLNPALWVALLIRAHLIEAFATPSDSMSPALKSGDRFIVNKKTGYGRWNIVGHDSLQNRQVKWSKRIVGLPGERIDIVDGELHVNGQLVPRPAEIPPYRDPGPGMIHNYPITLGADEYFVIGDNSVYSADSRLFSYAAPGHPPGVIPRDYILGKVTAIYWPPKRWRRFE